MRNTRSLACPLHSEHVVIIVFNQQHGFHYSGKLLPPYFMLGEIFQNRKMRAFGGADLAVCKTSRRPAFSAPAEMSRNRCISRGSSPLISLACIQLRDNRKRN